ncbi:SMI1/KNR4 family protein [Nonomuraea sp. NPDC046802]|uniref:SMI1/KNR4 family protein n=1 Tax=Nonomuraea sp. NPDC046802 TaxID=3154919 RepID=UPI0033EDA18C
MVDDVLRAMAEKIAADAPEGWRRAELHAFAGDDGWSGYRGVTFESDGRSRRRSSVSGEGSRRRSPTSVQSAGDGEASEHALPDASDDGIDMHQELRELHELVGATSDHLTIELVVEAKGRYEAVLSEALERDDDGYGFLYVLSPDTLPPEPGTFQREPGDLRPTGDPREAVELIGAYLRERDRVLGRDTYAPPPALPSAQRSWLEARLPCRLPDDLRALYALVDGDGGQGLLDQHPWFGLEMLENHSRPENRWWSAGRRWRHHLISPLITSVGPPQAVRRLSDHPRWIPFATTTLGDFLAVDMAPGPGGRPGQVIRMGLHYDDGPVYVADSVTALLRRHVAALRAGAFRVEEGELLIDLGEQPYEESRSLRVAGADARSLRGLHPGIERLSVTNAPWVDFTPARGAPALLQVTVDNCPGADLAPLRDTPLELLDLAMDGIDLGPLAGHTTLRMLRLRTERSVDLTPLTSCPRLYGLDLSQSAIADISVLGELKNLLYLRLRRAQWEELWERAGHPAGLAAAGLADEPRRERAWWWSADRAYHAREPSLRTAAKWANDLAGQTADVRLHTGRFTRPRR